MSKVQHKTTHILIDLENIELSIQSLFSSQYRLFFLDKLVDNLAQKQSIKDYQVHVFMPMNEEPVDWQIRKRDKLRHLGYKVIAVQKSFNGEYAKADLDAVMGTMFGIVCSLPSTKEVWLVTGDGDFIPAIELIREEYPEIKIKLACVRETTKSELFKNADDWHAINIETPGIVVQREKTR